MTREEFAHAINFKATQFQGQVIRKDDRPNGQMQLDVTLPNLLQASMFSQDVIFDLMAKAELAPGDDGRDYRDVTDPCTVTVTKSL